MIRIDVLGPKLAGERRFGSMLVCPSFARVHVRAKGEVIGWMQQNEGGKAMRGLFLNYRTGEAYESEV